MNSKNNRHRPKGEREYFDKPFSYAHQGFMFSPVHKRPAEVDPEGDRTLLKSKWMTPRSGGFTSFMGGTGSQFYSLKNRNILPVTNGMSDM